VLFVYIYLHSVECIRQFYGQTAYIKYSSSTLVEDVGSSARRGKRFDNTAVYSMSFYIYIYIYIYKRTKLCAFVELHRAEYAVHPTTLHVLRVTSNALFYYILPSVQKRNAYRFKVPQFDVYTHIHRCSRIRCAPPPAKYFRRRKPGKAAGCCCCCMVCG